MTILKAFPGAEWVGSKMPGKAWRGTTNPTVVIHTLEFNAWPNPDRWDSPAHIVCNPNTREVHQYLPMDRAAYAVRDNALEDDEPTFQVELWGKAANVPGYDDNWYAGVAALCQTFIDEYGIPLHFADFSNVAVAYPGASPDRMSDDEVREFSGFLGHCHMGLGVDTHWDPGRLDTDQLYALLEDDMAFTHFIPGNQHWEWEPIVWWLYRTLGGEIDIDGNSSQLTSLMPWKADVPEGVIAARYVQWEDLMVFADATNMGQTKRARMAEEGLYRAGLELSRLAELVGD